MIRGDKQVLWVKTNHGRTARTALIFSDSSKFELFSLHIKANLHLLKKLDSRVAFIHFALLTRSVPVFFHFLIRKPDQQNLCQRAKI